MRQRKAAAQSAALLAFLSFICLALLGVLFVATSSYAGAGTQAFRSISRHILFFAVSFVIFCTLRRSPESFWFKIGIPIFIASFVLAVAVVHPAVSKEIGGARRWLVIGGISIQPTEFLKIGLIFTLSWWLTRRACNVRKLWPGFILAMVIIGLTAVVCELQNDLGTCLVMLMTGMGVISASGARKRHIFAVLLLLAAAVVGLIRLQPYRMDRIIAWWHPWEYKSDEAYQNVQAFYALGEGGWTGSGLGQGRAKYYIPAPHTDFVFATVAEETGVIGPIVIIGLFGILGFAGLKIAKASGSEFARLSAAGVVFYLCGQALLNIGVVTGLLPCTGVPLPFISYGGSSLVAATLGVTVLISLSRSVKRMGVGDCDEGDGDRRGNRRTHIPGPGDSLGPSRPRPRDPAPLRR